jgi:hypothetical protein
MSLADDGDRLLKAGHPEAARACYVEALAAERDAAMATTTQPDRAILLRSAAWLAVNAGDHAEAVRLADIGLADPTTMERDHYELQAVAQAAKEMTP